MSKSGFKGEPQKERRDRPGHHIRRTTKGHPRREARRRRAADRLAIHAYDPERCGPNCAKKEAA